MSINIDISKKYEEFNLGIKIKSDKNIIGLVGDSGSGKTLTLKCISGIINPDSGYISVNNKEYFNSKSNLNILSKNRKVGYLFQDYALFPHLTVFENIMICITERDISKKEDIANKLLTKFRAIDIKNKYPKDLSGGEKQRVAFARMMSINPEIILLDEPFSALDSNLKWKLQYEVREFLKDFKGTVFLVTHNIEEASSLCEEIYVINNGSIVESGDSKTLFENPKSYYTAKFLGYKNFDNIKFNKDQVDLEKYKISFEVKNIPNWSNVIALNEKEFFLKSIPNSLEFFGEVIDIINNNHSIIFVLKVINSKELLFVEIPMKNSYFDFESYENYENILQKFVNVYYPLDKIIYLNK